MHKGREEIYISTDIEADGPIPGLYSMLSFGSAAFSADNDLPIMTFEANLETLPEATQDLKTMEWWATQEHAWNVCRNDPKPPAEVIPKYLAWLRSVPGKPVFVGYPATYDFMFLYYYCVRFGQLPPGGKVPFSHAGLDMKSYAMAILKKDKFEESAKCYWPRNWSAGMTKHSHCALEDAIGQGTQFIRMLQQNLRR